MIRFWTLVQKTYWIRMTIQIREFLNGNFTTSEEFCSLGRCMWGMKVLGMFVPMNLHSFHELITVFCWYVITFLDMLHTHVLHVVVVRFILSYSLLLQVVLMISTYVQYIVSAWMLLMLNMQEPLPFYAFSRLLELILTKYKLKWCCWWHNNNVINLLCKQKYELTADLVMQL